MKIRKLPASRLKGLFANVEDELFHRVTQSAGKWLLLPTTWYKVQLGRKILEGKLKYG